tara:strand:- start:255 stop:521 length:267 start_codon:yes stop_codon:yes gene_type:complete
MKRDKPGLQMNKVQTNAQNFKINPDDLEDIVCDKCGSQCFEQTFLFKKLSAVYSPSGKEAMIPVQIYRCADCGHINSEFLPKNASIDE